MALEAELAAIDGAAPDVEADVMSNPPIQIDLNTLNFKDGILSCSLKDALVGNPGGEEPPQPPAAPSDYSKARFLFDETTVPNSANFPLRLVDQAGQQGFKAYAGQVMRATKPGCWRLTLSMLVNPDKDKNHHLYAMLENSQQPQRFITNGSGEQDLNRTFYFDIEDPEIGILINNRSEPGSKVMALSAGVGASWAVLEYVGPLKRA